MCVDEVLSMMTTDVETDATVTPVIWMIAVALSAFRICATAMELGDVEIAYGGAPPLTETFCDAPVVTVTLVGAAVSEGGGVVTVGWVGELLLLQ